MCLGITTVIQFHNIEKLESGILVPGSFGGVLGEEWASLMLQLIGGRKLSIAEPAGAPSSGKAGW